MLTVAPAVIGAVGSIVGIWAFIDARRNRRIKLLGWEPTHTAALATATRAERDYKLSILYERQGDEPEKIDGAYVTYLRLANFGREPIRRADIADANPLRLRVAMGENRESKVLDVL